MSIGCEPSELASDVSDRSDARVAEVGDFPWACLFGANAPSTVAGFGPTASRNGLMTVDRECAVLTVNRTAQSILARADALVRDGARMRALRKADDDALVRLVAQAANGTGGSFMLPRRWGGRDYLLAATPARNSDGSSATVSILIADPDSLPEPTAEWLQRLFGLTVAEARLAMQLFSGLTLAEAARESGTSLATVRVHLAHIFRKTRTSRQAEFVRLMMSYPWDELAALRADDNA